MDNRVVRSGSQAMLLAVALSLLTYVPAARAIDCNQNRNYEKPQCKAASRSSGQDSNFDLFKGLNFNPFSSSDSDDTVGGDANTETPSLEDGPSVSADGTDFISYPPPAGPKRTIGVLAVESQVQNPQLNQAQAQQPVQGQGMIQFSPQNQGQGSFQFTPQFQGQNSFQNTPQYQGQGQADLGGQNSGAYLGEMVVTELVRSGHFVVIYDDGASQNANQDGQGSTTASQQASEAALKGAQLLVKTVVKRFEYQNTSNAGGLSLSFSNFNLGSNSQSAVVAMDVRLIDPKSSQIIDARPIEAEASTSGFDLGFAKSGQQLQLGSDAFQESPLGQATQLAVQRAVFYVIEKSNAAPWSGRIIKAEAGQAYVNKGLNYNLGVGDKLTVYAKGEDLIDPETGLNLGAEEEAVGSLVLTTVKEKFAIGRYSLYNQQGLIKRGDIVRFISEAGQ